ncbi:MAG TPA: tetratricopeptide repeat protein [Gammaproteobacteria bacterium]|nr:tetratricopeptide repeat protein [Gammaproteobacteria bacterium]
MSGTQQTQPDALLQQGIRLDQAGQHDAAAALYRKILEQQADHAYASHLLGANALRNGNPAAAVELISTAIRNNAHEPVFHFFLGQALQETGDLQGALSAYSLALSLAPRFPPAMFRRATVLVALQRLPEALDNFRQALAAEPELGHTGLQQARACKNRNELDTARRLLHIVLEYHPHMREAHVELGNVLLAQEQYDEAREIFARLFRLERGTGWGDAPFTEETTGDTGTGAEQLRASPFFFENLAGHIDYLVARGRLHGSFTGLAEIYREFLAESTGRTNSQGLITLSPAQARRVQAVLPKALHYADSAPIPGAAVNPALNGMDIQQDYRDSPWQMTCFDDFLTPEALNSLRDFCLESTIFFRQSPNTFVSSYLDEGFNCSILYQIASELKATFPDVLGPLHLQNIWCYRQAPSGDGVRAHSDQAAVTFNFWITADDANLDKDSGGLVLYDREQPHEWDWYKTNYEKDNPEVLQRIMSYLQDANTKTIPYRENRAVMFYSNMFHRSDRFRFKRGYSNSRMNVTMLFGQHASQTRRMS